MDLNKQRLIKQCQISLGEEFDQDFLYFEEADFTSMKSIQATYELFEKNLDGRTREFKEKIKKLSYAKGSLGEDEDVEESTAAYAKSLEKIAKDRQMKMLSKKDKETLIKIAQLMKTANEEKEEVNEAKKITKKERDELEDKNHHWELALRLAQSFGTPAEVKKIKSINKKHMQRGSIMPKERKERDAISNKYYKMAESLEEVEIQEGLLSKNDKTSGYAGRGQLELKKHIMPLVKKNKALKDTYFDGPDLVGDTKKGKQTTIAKGVLTDKKMTVADLEKAIMSFKESIDKVNEAKKITKKERDELEDKNHHWELALRLAQSFGTPAEVKKIKSINKKHMQRGSIMPKDQKERDAISNKYYKMAESLEEATELLKKGKLTLTKFSMGKGKVGLQINYGGKDYIQIPEKDIKQLYQAIVYVTKSVPQFKI